MAIPTRGYRRSPVNPIMHSNSSLPVDRLLLTSSFQVPLELALSSSTEACRQASASGPEERVEPFRTPD